MHSTGLDSMSYSLMYGFGFYVILADAQEI